ncbi:MAG: hypothetical protein Q9M36_00875 [Sulfurovum sp.]|nr:hypothetical protein [Sulfurovum sp.]
MTLNTIKPILLYTLLSLMFMGCDGYKNHKEALNTKNVSEYGDDLSDAVGEYEESRTDVSTAIIKSTTNVSKKQEEKSVQIREISQAWEDNWKDAKKEFKDLDERFSTLGKISQDYFKKLNQVRISIDDKEIRNSEKIKNIALKKEWTQAYKQASSDMLKLSKIIVKGDDVHKVLLAATMREKLVHNIDALKDISQQASVLLKSLHNLTIEGQKLIRPHG